MQAEQRIRWVAALALVGWILTAGALAWRVWAAPLPPDPRAIESGIRAALESYQRGRVESAIEDLKSAIEDLALDQHNGFGDQEHLLTGIQNELEDIALKLARNE